MLIGMAAAECSHKDCAGAATGFVGLFAYMGARCRGIPWPGCWRSGTGTASSWFISVAAGVSALLLPLPEGPGTAPAATEPG